MCSFKSCVTNVCETVTYHVPFRIDANDYIKGSEVPRSKQTLFNPAFKQLVIDRMYSGKCATMYSALNRNSYQFWKIPFAIKYDLLVEPLIFLTYVTEILKLHNDFIKILEYYTVCLFPLNFLAANSVLYNSKSSEVGRRGDRMFLVHLLSKQFER